MKVYHTYIIHNDPPSYLELLVQLISVCNHKYVNPDVPFVFATDKKSLGFYEKLGMLDFYDEVVTDFFDDYPTIYVYSLIKNYLFIKIMQI